NAVFLLRPVTVRAGNPYVEWMPETPPARPENTDERNRPMSQATLDEIYDALPLEAMPLPCPHCGQHTQNLKRYRIYDYLLFLFFGAGWQLATYTACARCMRRIIGLRTALNVVSANFLFPLVFVPHVVQFLRSFAKGHSRSILQILRERA